MADTADLIRSAFPRWRDDPYQHAAVDALCAAIFAGENAERAIDALGEAVAFFIHDPPLSLTLSAPRHSLEVVARRLDGLAAQIRLSLRAIADLEPYADQFGTRGGAE